MDVKEQEQEPRSLEPEKQGLPATQNIFFCFGPGDGQFFYYLARTNAVAKAGQYRLPASLYNSIGQLAIAQVYSATFSLRKTMWMLYRDVDGSVKEFRSSELAAQEPNLVAWLDMSSQSRPMLVFGQESDSFAYTTLSKSSLSTGKVPNSKKFAKDLNGMEKVERVCLGWDKSYLISGYVGGKQSIAFSGSSAYRCLKRVLKNRGEKKVTFCALDPHHDSNFFLLLDDSEAHYCVSETFEPQLRQALEARGITCTSYKKRRNVEKTLLSSLLFLGICCFFVA